MTTTVPTGLPSKDQPWRAYYPKQPLHTADCSAYACLFNADDFVPDGTAIAYYSARYTYRQLKEAVERYAKAFTALGVTRGDVVVLALPTTPENIFAFYALNRLGAIVDLVDLRSKDEVLLYYLKETGARVILACDLFAEQFIQAAQKLDIAHLILVSPLSSLPAPVRLVMGKKHRYTGANLLSLSDFLRAGEQTALPKDSGRGADAAVIMHTSGTTGMPKGVLMSNHAMNSMVDNCAALAQGQPRGSVFLNQVPPFLAYNLIMATHLPLCRGFTLRLLPEYRPDLFAANISKFKPCLVIAGPADWGNFLEKPPKCKNFSFLHVAFSGSDSMNLQTMEAVNGFLKSRGSSAQICEGYGMTEIGAAAVVNLPGHMRPGSVGVPLAYNNLCIYDNNACKELSYNETGEICMSGPTLMSGYYNNEAATQETLKRHADGTLWLHSGDLGSVDEDGFVYLEGRLKRILIRYDGIKVSPYTIEKTVLRHAHVAACCTVGKPDTQHGFGETPAVFVVLKDGAPKQEEMLAQLHALCEQGLAEKYRPSAFIFKDALPLTPNGKVDYRVLEASFTPTKENQ